MRRYTSEIEVSLLEGETDQSEDILERLVGEVEEESDSIVLSQTELIPAYDGQDFVILNEKKHR